MREYKNESEDLNAWNDPDPVQLILDELKDLFGLYERKTSVWSVHKFLISDLPDVRHKEVVQFVRYWASLDQVRCPSHKDIKRYIMQLRLRGKNDKGFEAAEKCPHKKCDGGGFIIGIKDSYHHAFNCKCNPKGGLSELPSLSEFDSTIGEFYG